MSNYKFSKETQNKLFEYSIKDEMLHFKFEEGVKVDIDIAKQLVMEPMLSEKGEAYAIIMDVNKPKDITKEAQRFLEKENSKRISAVAYVSKSRMAELFSNFLLIIDKPEIPTKHFSNKEDAEKWVKKTKNNQKRYIHRGF